MACHRFGAVAIIPILLDTNAYAGFKRGDAEAIAILRAADTIGLSAVVLGELLSGFAFGSRKRTIAVNLMLFRLAASRPAARHEDTARFYADVYQQLRRKGKPIAATISGSPPLRFSTGLRCSAMTGISRRSTAC